MISLCQPSEPSAYPQFKPMLQDLVIVGGGIGGISAGEAVALCIEKEQQDLAAGQRRSDGTRFSSISGVSLLLGGSSLAFSPQAGEFAEYLTLAGSDTLRRDAKLFEHQERVEKLFSTYGFDFRRNAFAHKISTTNRGTFAIQATQNERAYSIQSRRIVLALGHSLRETPTELQTHIIRGTGELCRRLSELHAPASAKEQTLDAFLSRFRPMEDGVIHIAIVGFGASCVEAIKIFHSLLAPPDPTHPFFHTVRSLAPVQFTLIDSGIGRFFGSKPIDLMEYIRNCHEKVEGSDDPGSLLKKRDEELQKQAVQTRFSTLMRGGQLKVIGSRLNWNEVRLHDGLVQVPMSDGGSKSFSCVVDCAPFINGIGPKHRDLLAGLPALKITPHRDGAWHVDLRDESFRSQVGLVGAAFRPPSDWDATAIFRHAVQTVLDLFPSKSEPSGTQP